MHLLFLEGIFVSLGENKALKLIDNDRDGVIKLNQHMLVRTYPAGSRTDSSNYNPVPMWNTGCQVGEYQVVINQMFWFFSLKDDMLCFDRKIQFLFFFCQILCVYICCYQNLCDGYFS